MGTTSKCGNRGGGGEGAFVALRHAAKTSPQRHAATTGARASGVQPSRRLALPHSHI